MADGKWIDDLTADTPLAEAARQALRVRLEVVQKSLRPALEEPDKDPEYVHQLRVGTRRAGAALRIFKPCLPKAVHKKVRQRLRKLRRAAGAARDWDVFLDNLRARRRGRTPAGQLPGLDFLLGYARAQRLAAQGELRAAGVADPADFEAFLRKTVAAVREPETNECTTTLLGLARPMLRELLEALRQAAARDLRDYALLHQVRIAGKHLRYAMELFADCFAPAFREEIYPAVEEMQDILGLANDSHVAGCRLAGLRKRLQTDWPDEWLRWQPGINALWQHHRRRLPQQRRRFLGWWKRWENAGTESALDTLLK